MRLVLCLAALVIGSAGCDLVTEPDGPSPEDFDYEPSSSSTKIEETVSVVEAVSTTTDARLRQRHDRFVD